MYRGWILGLWLAALPLRAEVYRCEVNGRPVYTDAPCSAQARPHALPDLTTLPPGAQEDLAREHDERARRERGERDKSDAQWLKSHEADRARQAEFDAAAAEHRALKGMSQDQLRRALGGPDEVEHGAGGSGEQTWIYGFGKSSQRYVLRDGRVVRISASKRSTRRHD